MNQLQYTSTDSLTKNIMSFSSLMNHAQFFDCIEKFCIFIFSLKEIYLNQFPWRRAVNSYFYIHDNQRETKFYVKKHLDFIIQNHQHTFFLTFFFVVALVGILTVWPFPFIQRNDFFPSPNCELQRISFLDPQFKNAFAPFSCTFTVTNK